MYLVLIYMLLTLSAIGEAILLCPANITTFSTGAFKNIYYRCEKEGEPAVLQTCPENQVYWAVKQKCSPERMINEKLENRRYKRDPNARNSAHNKDNADIKALEMPVLGNPVLLGCLYNAKTHKIMVSDSFWKKETVDNNKVTAHSFSSDNDYFGAQTTMERLNHMDIDVSLKVQFLGGLVSVEGSAGFLRDSVDTENTVAINMIQHYVTRTEILPTNTEIDFTKMCELKDLPTHVVTSIVYGMDANFLFKKKVRKHESRQDIEGKLKIVVKAFPGIHIDGSGSAYIDESTKETTNNMDVKLFGDFVLNKQPTTYEDSLIVFQTLSKHLGEKPDYALAAPIKMHLTPITRFCDETTAILISISNTLLQGVSEMFGKIERTKLKATTLQHSDSVNKYLPLKRNIDTFINKLDVFELRIKSELQTILPSIRSGGTSGENNLVQLLAKYTTSPFNERESSNFLKIRSREIETIDFILNPESFKGTEVITLDFEKASDNKILFTKPYVIMLKYNILPPMMIVERYLEGKPVDESNSWFNDQKIIASMGEEFKKFINFANANRNTKDHGFLIGLHSTNKTHTNIYAQRNGVVLSDSFDIPKAPPKMVPTTNKYNAIQFSIVKPSNKWVTSFIITYTKIFRGSAMEKKFNFDSVSLKTAIITNLQPNTIYEFNLKYVTVMGNSPSSATSKPIVTRPCSPPTNLYQSSVTSSGFDITWSPPLYIGKGVNISGYEVTVRGNDFLKEITTLGVHLTIKEVSPASEYSVIVTAIVNSPRYNESSKPEGVSTSSLAATLMVISSPNPPSTLNLVDVSFRSAEINWNIPQQIAVGASVKDYLVKYGNESDKGTAMTTRSSNNKTSITLQDLVQGTTYGISVKVLTSLGDSGYSSTLIIKTKFKETELDVLRQSVKTELTSVMDKKVDDLRKKQEKVMDKKVDNLRKKQETVMNEKVSIINRTIVTVDSTVRGLESKLERQERALTKHDGQIQELRKEILCQPDKVIFFPEHTTRHAMKQCYTFGSDSNDSLRFVGYGSSGSADDGVYSYTTFTSCVSTCQGKRRNDVRWNGMRYRWSSGRCVCWRNMKGLKPIFKDTYVLYAFDAY